VVVPEKQGLKLGHSSYTGSTAYCLSGGSRKTRIETKKEIGYKREVKGLSGGSRKTRIETRYPNHPRFQ
jgi:hypothetical protein